MIKKIYRILPRCGPLKYIIFERVRRWLMYLLSDPAVEYSINGKLLEMPLSHQLPIIQHFNPNYDQLPIRLGEFLRERSGSVKCIDIGANVGDSIAALQGGENDRFLAIEPSDNFVSFLRRNWLADSRISISQAIVSNESGQNGEYALHEGLGTARLTKCLDKQEAATMRACVTLDQIYAKGETPEDLNVIKIDTDGFDLKIILGAPTLIRETMPFIVFEFGVFGNNNFHAEVKDVINLLEGVGYARLLVYDNRGYSVGEKKVVDGCLDDIITYMKGGGVPYYDILLLPPRFEKEFIDREFRQFGICG